LDPGLLEQVRLALCKPRSHLWGMYCISLRAYGVLMKQFITKLATDEAGQDLIEYALVAALVGLGAVAAMKGLSTKVGNTFNSTGNSLTNAVA